MLGLIGGGPLGSVRREPLRRTLNGSRRPATCDPTIPSPTMQTVLPASASPGGSPQRPEANPAGDSGSRRRSASSNSTACSATSTALSPGHVGDPHACRGCGRDVDVFDACAELLNQA